MSQLYALWHVGGTRYIGDEVNGITARQLTSSLRRYLRLLLRLPTV
jgi:hypothetical protein